MPNMQPVFGYGSLMNRSTLPYELVLRRASIRGWARQWRNPFVVNGVRMCCLTVQPRPNSALPGVVLSDGSQELDRILMERESPDTIVSVLCMVDQSFTISANMYVAARKNMLWASAEAPIFLSYLDCVLQGCLRLYGPAGVVEFLTSTEGWHLPLIDDRKHPKYNRSIKLSKYETNLIDSCLLTHNLLLS